MFSKKGNVDLKKSSLKVLDVKKDSLSRLKHLKIVLDNCDVIESKRFFEHHYSHIYFIFFDSLAALEGSFKNKGESAMIGFSRHHLANVNNTTTGHKQAKEELDSVILIFEKIFLFLPELIRRRWQFHSIKVVLQKLLHPANHFRVRQDGIRCFLLWFQILGSPVDSEVKAMFESLVPLKPHHHQQSIQSHHATHHHHPHGESGPSLFYTDSPASVGGHSGIDALIPRDRNFSASSTLIRPVDIEPILPAFPNDPPSPADTCGFFLQTVLEYMVSKVKSILWTEQAEAMHAFCFNFLFEQLKETYIKIFFPDINWSSCLYQSSALRLPEPRNIDDMVDLRPIFLNSDLPVNAKATIIRWFAKYISRDAETQSRVPPAGIIPPGQGRGFGMGDFMMTPYEWREPTLAEYELVRHTLCASRANVNLINELLRQAFLLPFSQSVTMKRVINVYKEWVSKNTPDIPKFLEEPVGDDILDVRLGTSRIIRSFVSNSANIFVVDIPQDRPLMLEEQVEMCKRVLNIYRYMVMKIEMDRETWETLLLILLRITSIVIPPQLPARKEDTLGGRLAPAFFQTLIVTWIRANLHVHVSLALWEEFQRILSQLTEWEELIREWSKTMDTITRVMSRYVYNINLLDLPLDRLNVDRKDRRRRGMTRVEGDATSKTPTSSQKSTPTHTVSPTTTTQSPSLTRRRSSTGISRRGHKNRSSTKRKLRRSFSDSNISVQSFKNKKNDKSNRRPSSITRGYSRQNSRSLELLDRHDSPDFSDDDTFTNRSRSPSPSSGRDSSSLKESPLNLDGVSMSSNISETSTTRSVIAGGVYRGWAADSSVILWRRMLGVLGDINTFKNVQTYSQVMDCLYKIVDDLMKVKDNLGVSENASPAPPTLVPPIGYFSPWLLQAQSLPNDFKRGKLTALRTLCKITLRRHDTPPSPDFLCHFYQCLLTQLSSKDLDITAVVLKVGGSKFFSYGLPGVTCLLHPLLDSCDLLFSKGPRAGETDFKGPRQEALSFLGSVVGLSTFLENIQRISCSMDTSSPSPPSSPQSTVRMSSKDVRERVVSLVLRGVRRDLSVSERGLALNCLGLFVYQELSMKSRHPRLTEAMTELISSLQYPDKTLLRISCEMLLLQVDHVVYLLDDHPDIPRKIIEGLNHSLLLFIQQGRHDSSLKEIVLTLVMCLGSWCMAVPVEFLKVYNHGLDHNSSPLIRTVMKTLNAIISEDDILVSDTDSQVTLRQAGRTGSSVHFPPDDPEKDVESIKLAAQMLMGYLINHLGHFPRCQLRATRLNCCLQESDDNPHISRREDADKDELSAEVMSSPNSLFFVVNNSSIISFTEITGNIDDCRDNNNLSTSPRKVRVIIRDLIGKFSWDCQQIYINKRQGSPQSSPADTNMSPSRKIVESNASDDYDDGEDAGSDRIDILDSLLQFFGQNDGGAGGNRTKARRTGSCFSLTNISTQRNVEPTQAEFDMIALLQHQHHQELFKMEQRTESNALYVTRDLSRETASTRLPTQFEETSPDNLLSSHNFFANCCRLIDQIGFLSWEKRTRVDLLSKSDRVLRELRNLDNQKCRETHKIAVIYVGEGQEDKNSILLNSSGSRAFESFVSGLGWEVDLDTHTGFRGGLQSNRSTGLSAPYYSTSLMEVIFHVSTRIPASLDDTESLTKKLRHLGNDEIHIVWSEHWRDYRRGIIPTEFGDVLIVIYPIPTLTDFYRISIIRKGEVPPFGPLYTGSVVHFSLLPGLVRATAINASRAQRLNVPFYQNFFEERSRSIQSIVQNRESKSFEDYAANVFCPSFSHSLLGTSSTTGNGLRPVSAPATGSNGGFPDSSVQYESTEANPPATPASHPVSSKGTKVRPQTVLSTTITGDSARMGRGERPISTTSFVPSS